MGAQESNQQPSGASNPVGIVPAAAPPAEGTASTPDARSTEFRAVEGGSEVQSGVALMTEAYAAIWLCVFALVVAGMRRLRRLESRLDGLSQEVARAREQQAKKG